MKKLIIWSIVLYQNTPLKSHNSCVFIPTCSEYTKESIYKYGVILGVFYGIKRILRCHPWQKNHYDPVK